MASMTTKLIWDDDLGPAWMNPDNLNSLLYTEANTNMFHLLFEVIDPEAAREFVMEAMKEASMTWDINSLGQVSFDSNAAKVIGDRILDFFLTSTWNMV